jgi:hypothetical protein
MVNLRLGFFCEVRMSDTRVKSAITGAKTEGDEGSVVALFAKLNVEDHDGDVTLPGAFETGKRVLISQYNHSSWMNGGSGLPVGTGHIEEKGDEAIFTGKFNLNMQAGRETYEAVKMAGANQEWSYGFRPVDVSPGVHDGKQVQLLKKLDVFEVSPVIRGAGIETRTVDIKSASKLSPTDHLVALKGIDDREFLIAAIKDLGKVLGANDTGELVKIIDGIEEDDIDIESAAALANAKMNMIRYQVMDVLEGVN